MKGAAVGCTVIGKNHISTVSAPDIAGRVSVVIPAFVPLKNIPEVPVNFPDAGQVRAGAIPPWPSLWNEPVGVMVWVVPDVALSVNFA